MVMFGVIYGYITWLYVVLILAPDIMKNRNVVRTKKYTIRKVQFGVVWCMSMNKILMV